MKKRAGVEKKDYCGYAVAANLCKHNFGNELHLSNFSEQNNEFLLYPGLNMAKF